MEKTWFLIQSISDGLLKDLDEGTLRSWLETVLPKVLAFFWCVVLALLAYFIGMKVINMFRKGIKKGLVRHGAEVGVQQFMDAVVKVIGYIALIFVIFRV